METRSRRSGYNPQEIEPKWQEVWAERGVMKADDASTKPKFYNLVMFPYPSGPLHMGHMRNYVIGDLMSPVNWCPVDKTVLANEQVINGRCWRHPDVEVEKRDLEQWFLRITDYADRLLDDLSLLDHWPEKVRVMQANWIGRSQGVEVEFPIDEHPGDSVRIYTTRPDTLFGVTFMVLAPEHPLVDKLTVPSQQLAVREAVESSRKEREIDRMSSEVARLGAFTGAHAINPLNGEKVPIWVGYYVLITYGTGAIMAVPGHDQRDFDFAQQFGLPIREVIAPEGRPQGELATAYTGPGSMINSGQFDGLDNKIGFDRVAEFIEQKGIGSRSVKYRLRDWLISRQRYWGCPIPVVHCEVDGIVAVPRSELPVLLPREYKPPGHNPDF